MFHGTNSFALSSILKNGLCSAAELKKNNIERQTGEFWTEQADSPRNFISFTDDLETALDYSNFPSKQVIGKPFPVILGITNDVMKMSRTTPVHSDLREIGLKKNIDPKNIKVIAVPKEYIEYVRELSKSFGIQDVLVISIPNIKYNKKNMLEKIKDLSLTRKISDIKKILENFKKKTDTKEIGRER